MLVSEILTRVQKQFGDEAGSIIKVADVVRWVNDAMRDIALSNNLFQVRATSGLVSGEAEYSLPTNVLTLHTVKVNGEKLRAISMQEGEKYQNETDTSTGTPQTFWQWADNIWLNPTPDRTIAAGLTLYYTRVPIEVTTGTDLPEIPVQYHNRLVEYCIAQAAELDDNLQLANMKMMQFQGAVQAAKDNAEWTERDYYPSISVISDDYYCEY